MATRGYFEAKNFSMIDKAASDKFKPVDSKIVEIDNPMSQDQSALRPSLIPGLLKNLTYNIDRMQKTLCIFEIGKVFFDREEVTALAALTYGSKYPPLQKASNSFAELLGDLYCILDKEKVELKNSNVIWLNSKMSKSIWYDGEQIGLIGQISATGYHHKYLGKIFYYGAKKHVLAGYPFIFQIKVQNIQRAKLHVVPIPKNLPIKRDVTIICSKERPYEQLLSRIKKMNVPFLISIVLKDVFYKSATQKSFTLELEFSKGTSTDIHKYLGIIEAISLKSG